MISGADDERVWLKEWGRRRADGIGPPRIGVGGWQTIRRLILDLVSLCRFAHLMEKGSHAPTHSPFGGGRPSSLKSYCYCFIHRQRLVLTHTPHKRNVISQNVIGDTSTRSTASYQPDRCAPALPRTRLLRPCWSNTIEYSRRSSTRRRGEWIESSFRLSSLIVISKRS